MAWCASRGRTRTANARSVPPLGRPVYAGLLLEAGTAIDRYTIESPLGRGGMGEVYRAHDARLRRSIALKVLHERLAQDGMMRLVREARLAASLSHPNIVAVFDVGEHNGVAYMAMELLDGKMLKQLVRTPVAAQEKLRWILDIARGLDAAHRAGLIHRDIKPQNVMVTASGAKVLDFGIAKEVEEAAVKRTALLPSLRTQPGFSMGTPRYMAPEVLRAEYPSDALTDQFSWGLVAFEVLTGTPPKRDDLDQGARWAPPTIAVPDVSARVSSIVERTLADDRTLRFPSMAELVRALEACLQPLPRTEQQPAKIAVSTGMLRAAEAADDPVASSKKALEPGPHVPASKKPASYDFDDEDSPLPDGRGSATATRMFPVRTPHAAKAARPSPSQPREAVAPLAVREPSTADLAPLVEAALIEIERTVPAGFRRAVVIVTLDVEGGKARFFAQIVATDETGELWAADASMDVVRAAAKTITADATNGNGRWLRLVLALQSGSREASVVSVE